MKSLVILGIGLFFGLISAFNAAAQDQPFIDLEWAAPHYQYRDQTLTYGFSPLPDEDGMSYGLMQDCFNTEDFYFEIVSMDNTWYVYEMSGWNQEFWFAEEQTRLVRGEEVFNGDVGLLQSWLLSRYCPEELINIEDDVIILRDEQVIGIVHGDAPLDKLVQIKGHSPAPISWNETDGWRVSSTLDGYTAISEDAAVLFVGIPYSRDVFADMTLDVIKDWMPHGIQGFVDTNGNATSTIVLQYN